MEKELLTTTTGSVTLNVTAGKIDSYRRKDETQNTVRVYEDGKIGVAGSLGDADWEALTAAAVEALSNGITYPCNLEANQGELDTSCGILSGEEFLPAMQRLLDRITAECPRFGISNKIQLARFTTTYQNSKGASLKASDAYLLLSLVFQNKGAGNLYDCAYGAQLRAYDEDAVVADCKKLHDAFYTDVDIEAGEYPVLCGFFDVLGSAIQHLVAEMYVSGASLFSGKLGQQVANAAFSLYDDRDPRTNPGSCFFDDEGQVAPDYRQPIIKNGVLTNLLVTKNTAAMFGLPPAATSGAAYDGIPSLTLSGFRMDQTHASVAELTKGKSILVLIASGGDMTPDGHYATPVQLAYLVEDGEIKGRLPELNIAGDFFDLIGDRYLGSAPNTLLPSMRDSFMACKMQVTK